MRPRVAGPFVILALAAVSLGRALAAPLGGYAERSAADSAVLILRALPNLSPAEADAARFLLANDLAEIGLGKEASILFASLSASSSIAPAAFAALARLRDEAGEDQALRIEARNAPWQRMNPEDGAEAAYHLARACIRDRRYPEVRSWVERVPEGSPFHPFARFLLAQAEYAFGDDRRALEAAEPIFSSRLAADARGALQERTALMLAEMRTEMGFFDDAADLLRWPRLQGPFRRRLERDGMVLESLAAIGRRSFGEAEAAAARLTRSFDAEVGEIEGAVGSRERLEARAAELTRNWPSRAVLARRRTWAAGRASASVARGSREASRPLPAVISASPSFESLVARSSAPEEPAAAEPATASAESRFFFAPSAPLDRLLTASRLLDEPLRDGCVAAAARSLREQAAAALLGERAEPGREELSAIAAGCGGDTIGGLTERAQTKLLGAISAEARRLVHELRRQQYVVHEAIARARADQQPALSETSR